MEDKLMKDVELLVKNIFSEKEEADMRAKTEEALQASATTIDDLTESLEAKNAEVEAAQAKIVEIEETVKNLQSELEAAKTEVETSSEKLTEAEAKIEDMLKDKAMDIRMSELESAGVVRSNKEGQATKVRELTDEEFAAYKDELVSIREAIVAEMEAAAAKTDEEQAGNPEEASEEEAGEEQAAEGEEAGEENASENDEEEGVDTPPANIDPSQAVSAALNMELVAPKNISKKYSDLGKAMAKMFTKE